MKYILFGNRVDIDNLNKKGVEGILESNYPHEVMTIDGEAQAIEGLAKVEQYGSFAFISEAKYNLLK